MLRRGGDAGGFSFVELLLVVAILGIIASILIPMLICQIEKSRVAQIIAHAVSARDALARYKLYFGRYPDNLQDAYFSGTPPIELGYCVADPVDANAGHGNEACDYDDEDNPSGRPGPQAIEVYGFLLWSKPGTFSTCTPIRSLSCTGGLAPIEFVRWGDKPKPPKGGGPK